MLHHRVNREIIAAMRRECICELESYHIEQQVYGGRTYGCANLSPVEIQGNTECTASLKPTLPIQCSPLFTRRRQPLYASDVNDHARYTLGRCLPTGKSSHWLWDC